MTLRPMTLDDAQAHLAGEDELMQRFLSGGVGTLDTAITFITRTLEMWRTGGHERVFGIRDAVTDELVGTVDAKDLDDLRPGVKNISFGLHPHVRGRGFATRAVRLIARYLVEEGLADAAVIQCDEENAASQAVAERTGFRYIGTKIQFDGPRLLTFVRHLDSEMS